MIAFELANGSASYFKDAGSAAHLLLRGLFPAGGGPRVVQVCKRGGIISCGGGSMPGGSSVSYDTVG